MDRYLALRGAERRAEHIGDVREPVDGDVALEQPAGRRHRLGRDDLAVGIDEIGEEDGVIADIGAGIDADHPRPDHLRDQARDPELPVALADEMRAEPFVAGADVHLEPRERAAEHGIVADIDAERQPPAMAFPDGGIGGREQRARRRHAPIPLIRARLPQLAPEGLSPRQFQGRSLHRSGRP